MNRDITNSSNNDQKDSVEAALAAWCGLLDQGDGVDRAAFLNNYDVAIREELSQCLQSLDFVQSAIPRPSDSITALGNGVSPHVLNVDGSFRLGDFEVEAEIGRGGMGVVYRATQVSLNRRVAVKILPFAALLDGRQLDRFRNEVRAAAMLKHPHVVSVISVGYERGLHYYAMELVEGCSLADVIRATHCSDKQVAPAQETTPLAELSTHYSGDRRLFFRTVARVGIQAGIALQAAHGAGIVHRDIKPSNLLIDRDGRLLIADFGLARMQTDQAVTMTGDLVGTLRYMSPEQLKNSQAADQRSDIYSLGLTLFELIAGNPTFNSNDRATVVTEIVEGNVPTLRRLVSDVPKDLETVIAKAASLSPGSRYQTATELVADLERFLAGETVQARQPGTIELLARWSKRNRSKAALLALSSAMLLAAAIGGPVVAIQQSREAQRQAEVVAKRNHEAYVADMRRTQQHLEQGEIDQAIRLLQTHIPQAGSDVDHRNFEWKYLAAKCQRRRTVQTIAVSRVFKACDLSGDDQQLAAGTWGGNVAVFNAKTGEALWKSTPDTSHETGICDVRFSSDDRLLISSSLDGQIKIFDAASGTQLFSKKFDALPSAMAAADRSLVLSWNPSGLLTDGFEAQTYLQMFTIDDDASTFQLIGPQATVNDLPYIHALEISPDAERIVGACADGVVRMWDPNSLELIRSRTLNSNEILTSASYSNDGKMIIVGSGYRQNLRLPANAYVVDAGTLEPTAVLPHSTEVGDAKFVANETCITATRAGILRVWNLRNGELVDQWAASSNRINELALANDGSLFLACQGKTLLRIPISNLSETSRAIASGSWGAMDVAFNPTSSEVACATNGRALRIHDADTGRLIRTTDAASHKLWATSYSSEGKYLAAVASPWPTDKETEAELVVFDSVSGKKLHQAKIPEINYARSIQFHPAENRIAIVGDGRLLFFDIEKRQFSRPMDAGGKSHVFYVDISGDGRFVGCVSSWGRGGVRIWRYPSMEPVLYRPVQKRPFIWGFALDSSGEHYAVADHKDGDYAVSVRKLPSGEHARSLIGHTDYVTSIDFSPDDKRLLTSGKDGQVILWNLETGQEILRFREHTSWVWRARFSPDGNSIASVQDRTDPSLVLRRAFSFEKAEAIVRPAISSTVFVEDIETIGSY